MPSPSSVHVVWRNHNGFTFRSELNFEQRTYEIGKRQTRPSFPYSYKWCNYECPSIRVRYLTSQSRCHHMLLLMGVNMGKIICYENAMKTISRKEFNPYSVGCGIQARRDACATIYRRQRLIIIIVNLEYQVQLVMSICQSARRPACLSVLCLRFIWILTSVNLYHSPWNYISSIEKIGWVCPSSKEKTFHIYIYIYIAWMQKPLLFEQSTSEPESCFNIWYDVLLWDLGKSRKPRFVIELYDRSEIWQEPRPISRLRDVRYFMKSYDKTWFQILKRDSGHEKILYITGHRYVVHAPLYFKWSGTGRFLPIWIMITLRISDAIVGVPVKQSCRIPQKT